MALILMSAFYPKRTHMARSALSQKPAAPRSFPCHSHNRNRGETSRMRMSVLVVALGCVFASAPANAAPVRVGPAESPIASSVGAPAGARIVYVSGTVPDVVQSSAAEGSIERYGDTESQTRSVLAKIEKELAKHGLDLADIAMMRVFLVAPVGQQRMDFAGMMRAFRERFGTAAQPNKPARSTMQVAGLVDPGWLVEIEATAVK